MCQSILAIIQDIGDDEDYGNGSVLLLTLKARAMVPKGKKVYFRFLRRLTGDI